jgi:hypothetical protein
LSVLSTYAKSRVAGCTGPEGGTHAPLLASATLPAGHTRQRCSARPASLTLLMTVPGAGAAHWQLLPDAAAAGATRAGSQLLLMVNPLPKAVSLPVLGSHSTQRSLSGAST